MLEFSKVQYSDAIIIHLLESDLMLGFSQTKTPYFLIYVLLYFIKKFIGITRVILINLDVLLYRRICLYTRFASAFA